MICMHCFLVYPARVVLSLTTGAIFAHHPKDEWQITFSTTIIQICIYIVGFGLGTALLLFRARGGWN